ncbi:MAG: pentapeptide repeat-containing protein [Methanotrichaceae archaeon]|nr:pentapeptide repeat-containing protein [Methanotrichaceae archaeon]
MRELHVKVIIFLSPHICLKLFYTKVQIINLGPMANQEQLKILRRGAKVWDEWKRKNSVAIDLSGANLSNANLRRADLSNANLRRADLSNANLSEAYLSGVHLGEAYLRKANLSWADLRGAYLIGADLREASLSVARLNGADLRRAYLIGAHLMGADLREADLREANLHEADLRRADLREANLREANLREADLKRAYLIGANLGEADLRRADLREADLREANLRGANFVETTLERTDLTDCKIYGISAWNVKIEGARQKDLVITPENEPIITVDNLEVAQFIYLLLHNEKIRDVIDTIAKKAVLILGRFLPQKRKVVLNALRSELRNRGFLPIVFDFVNPSTKDFTDTIRILAGMSLFVIVDMTNPKSSPLEMQAIVPEYMTPFVPLIQEGEEPFSMFRDFHIKYKQWVLAPLKYDSPEGLMAVFDKDIIEPALQMHQWLLAEKAAEFPHRGSFAHCG